MTLHIQSILSQKKMFVRWMVSVNRNYIDPILYQTKNDMNEYKNIDIWCMNGLGQNYIIFLSMCGVKSSLFI